MPFRFNFSPSVYLFLNFFSNFHFFVKLFQTLSNSIHPGSYSTISDKGRKGCPANPFPHPLIATSAPVSTIHKADLSLSAMLFVKSGILLAPEETSLRVSLMARDLPLGPSDVPCPEETSTAHGESFFLVTVFLTVKDKASWIPASTSDHAFRVLMSNLLTPEMLFWSQISYPSKVSRQTLTSLCPASAKLGFQLEGLITKLGPLSSLWPKPISCDPTFTANKSRSVMLILLSLFSQCIGRFSDLNGRRHHLRKKSPSLLCVYNHILRTLELVVYLAKSYDSKSLKVFSLLFPNLLCWKDDCGYRISVSKYFSTTIFAKDSKYRLNTNTNKPQPICSSLNGALEQSSSDYEIVVNGSPTFALLWLQSLLPSRNTSPAPSSTSLRLLTVTISPSIDSFVEARSTNRDLTCIQKLSSFGLKALMEPLSICFSYLLVFLGNAPLCNALNFGIFAPIFSMYLNFI